MTTLIPKFDFKNGGTTPTGAINIPINQKLAQYVSVVDFGADPTGTNDSATAIQNAINYAATTTGAVIFPAGTFLIGTALSLVGLEVAIYGAGTKNTIIKANATLTNMFNIVESTDGTQPYKTFVISGMSLNGNGTTTNAINIDYRHQFIIEKCAIYNCSYGITAANSYLGTYKNLTIQASTTGLNLVGSNHNSHFSSIDINSFNTFGIVINNSDLGDGNQAMYFNNVSVEYGVSGGGAVYVNSAPSSITFDTCYIGENVYGTLFQIQTGNVYVQGGYINYGYTTNSFGFVLNSASCWVKVEKSWIISQGQLGVESLAFGAASGSPEESGKITFQDIYFSEVLYSGAGGNATAVGDFLDFGPEQPVFVTRYGRNYTLEQSNCTATSTLSTVSPANTVTISAVGSPNPYAGLYASLTNTTESYFYYPQEIYFVVVYSSNVAVNVRLSNGAGGSGSTRKAVPLADGRSSVEEGSC